MLFKCENHIYDIHRRIETMKKIDIVVPCYNEQECIRPLFLAVEKVFQNIDTYAFSILYVNDGSKDCTLKEIKNLAEEFGTDRVKYISFARNFGKESAIYAGLEQSSGDYVVLMDADLQHPPELVPKMIKVIEEGYDCCGARRVNRAGEPFFRSFFSRIFYRVINKVTTMELVQGGSDYRMMTRQMVDAIVSLSERERFSKGIMSWVGFETKWIEYENVERFAGKSKWNFWGLAKYALKGYISFATTPLRLFIYLGNIVTLAALIYAINLFISSITNQGERSGYASIVLLLLFFGGVIISILGILGEYIARIYLELKNRPIYIQKESNIDKNNKSRGE